MRKFCPGPGRTCAPAAEWATPTGDTFWDEVLAARLGCAGSGHPQDPDLGLARPPTLDPFCEQEAVIRVDFGGRLAWAGGIRSGLGVDLG